MLYSCFIKNILFKPEGFDPSFHSLIQKYSLLILKQIFQIQMRLSAFPLFKPYFQPYPFTHFSHYKSN